eukprot:TRINITY_DN41965_c0_g1_i1.p1 TRINITY_DN41965_c0_g1~~TRINITY_DN41965_c0_g1_i1.p1  ORF type:complete len:974 (+),score=213.50 TRINITY_DN41965_c0_g1_i1:110-3031(+)
MMCLGPFCGKFRNELGGSSSEEDEDAEEDAHNMLGKKKKKKKRRTNKKGGGASGGAGLAWAPYKSDVRMTSGEGEKVETVTQLEVIGNLNLGDNMLRRINQLSGRIGIIKFDKCGLEKIPPSLDQLDGLMELRLPNNLIKKIPQELSQCRFLLQLVLDHNHISDIAPGIFSQMITLKVINLSHNRLQFLPGDFGGTSSTRVSSLRSLDLSNNLLTAIPDRVMTNRALVEMDLSHNKIKVLPEAYDLQSLEKLFVSFNELTKLPANIGNSKKLRKLRITSNEVKMLPVSMLKLWKRPDRADNDKDNGHLEELLVDRNPLQVPSITAFEMDAGRAGMDRAFRLLEEYKIEEDEKQRQAAEQKALEDRKVLLELKDAGDTSEVVRESEPSNDKSLVASSEVGLQLDAWYYEHCKDDEDMIKSIREAEQKFLVAKRHKYLSAQAKLAQEVQAKDGTVPEHMKTILGNDAYLNYRGVVPLTDIDLTLSLFVFAARPCYQSAYMWYDKFEQGLPTGESKGFMTKSEWCELCLNSPLDVRQATMDKLWAYMMSVSSSSYGMTVEDFIAVCHVHDIEARDPFILRLTTALRLDYYDMTVSEMEQRLRSMNSLDATLQLKFDNRSVPPEHYQELVGDTSRKQGREDEIQATLKQRDGLHKLLDSGMLPGGAKKAANPREENVEDLLKKVSLNDFERRAAARGGKDEDNSDVDSFDSMNSHLLSDDEVSELSEFDAQAYMEQNKDDLIPGSSVATGSAQRIQVSSDSGLRQLMNVPLKDFFKGREEDKRKQEPNSAYNRAVVSKKSARFKRPSPHDSTWSTNVFTVRQALRDAYRNMPFFDFASFVGFLLRGLHQIRESRNNQGDSHWHQDDPSFSFAMGADKSSKYTSTLLRRMGFVRLNDKYWVWPSVHLVFPEASVVWGMADVPPDCAGRDENRLEDMISLLTSCVISMNTKKQDFTGHFTGRESAQPTTGLAASEEVRL